MNPSPVPPFYCKEQGRYKKKAISCIADLGQQCNTRHEIFKNRHLLNKNRHLLSVSLPATSEVPHRRCHIVGGTSDATLGATYARPFPADYQHVKCQVRDVWVNCRKASSLNRSQDKDKNKGAHYFNPAPFTILTPYSSSSQLLFLESCPPSPALW